MSDPVSKPAERWLNTVRDFVSSELPRMPIVDSKFEPLKYEDVDKYKERLRGAANYLRRHEGMDIPDLSFVLKDGVWWLYRCKAEEVTIER